MMTSLTQTSAPPTAYGLTLIMPAYRSAFASIGTVWIPLAFGGAFAVANALLTNERTNQQIKELGGIGIALVLGYLGVLFFLYLVVSTKVWTGCFKAQNPQMSLPKALFGHQERAAFGALLEVSLATMFVALLPMFALAIIGALLHIATNGTVTTSPIVNVIIAISLIIVYNAISARYLMAIPMSIANTSTDTFKSDLLGQAWRRTRDWYAAVLMALIPIALLGEGARIAFDWIVMFAFDGPASVAASLVSAIIGYGLYVVTALATMHVILEIWSQTREVEFD